MRIKNKEIGHSFKVITFLALTFHLGPYLKQGVTGVERLWKEVTHHKRLRTTALDYWFPKILQVPKIFQKFYLQMH